MRSTVSRVLWIIIGVLLVLAGVICFIDPGVALEAISLYLGISMLVSGILDVVVYAHGRQHMIGAGWILADGILTILLSLFLLLNQTITMLSLPYIFGMWLLFSGVGRIVNSLDLHRLGVKGWGWLTALGILLTVAGFLAFVAPVTQLFAIGVLSGVLLILQGITAIVHAGFSNRFWQ